MDIITDFGSVVPGSSPGGCTKCQPQHASVAAVAFWHPPGLEDLARYLFEQSEEKYPQGVLKL